MYAYALQLYTLRWPMSILLNMRFRAFCMHSAGDFQVRRLVGVRLTRYAAAFTVSGHISSGRLAWIRMQRALATITPPERSAEPFCSGEYGTDVSRSIPSRLVHALKSFPSADSLLFRNILIFLSNWRLIYSANSSKMLSKTFCVFSE